ncbi:MAG TPA: protease modulator HflC [Candidatus Paceibacterota bacterium]|nr:protease modulator HflC [Candidatus Paceibacterota bacterium]
MKRNSLTLVIGLVLIVIFGLLLFTFQVRTTEVAVVTTFGKPSGDGITKPGIYLKAPWPIQRVYYFDKRVQNYDDKFTQDYTADKVTLLTSVYIGWRITDPKVFYPKFRDGSVSAAEKSLSDLVRNAKTATVGKHQLADFVSVEGGSNFTAIEKEMLTNIQAKLQENNYGISVDFLGLKKIGFPESVTQEIFTQMTSERQVLIEKLQREGETQAKIIKSGADRQAAEMLATAKGAATEIRGKGEAEAVKALGVFQQNPELAKFLWSLTAMEDSLKERATVILDQQNPPFDLFRGISTNRLTK